MISDKVGETEPWNSSEEIIYHVDLSNNVIGSVTRKQMDAGKLPHRCTFVLLKEKKSGQIYVHKRSMMKRWCPGYWDICFGGVVQYGESYEVSAQRELEEEAGVVEELTKVGDILY